MKQKIFNKYAAEVAKHFKITQDELFSKNKNRTLVDARYLLYYLCFKRPMIVSSIVNYMKENGYSVYHSTVIYGISVIESRVSEDKDYNKIVRSIESNVSI